MEKYQQQFIELAIAQNALSFGDFTLKSGRKSPYFFNAGLFNTGASLAQLGRHYAAAIVNSGVEFDMVFGPAYKGISLAAATAIALADEHQIDKPYGFNRKEAKDHGEGGQLVGAPLKGRVLIVDDVITAGTAIREVVELIGAHGAETAAVVIGLNRQEKGRSGLSTIDELAKEFSIPVISIAVLDDIITYLEKEAGDEQLAHLVKAYRSEYGA